MHFRQIITPSSWYSNQMLFCKQALLCIECCSWLSLLFSPDAFLQQSTPPYWTVQLYYIVTPTIYLHRINQFALVACLQNKVSTIFVIFVLFFCIIYFSPWSVFCYGFEIWDEFLFLKVGWEKILIHFGFSPKFVASILLHSPISIFIWFTWLHSIG